MTTHPALAPSPSLPFLRAARRAVHGAVRLGAALAILALGTTPFARGQDILASLDGTSGDHLGSLAGIGDLTGDGIPDLLCGAPDATSGRGVVRLVSGATGSVVWSRTGGSAGAHLGTALASIGDLNGDGHLDLAAGAPGADRVLLLSGANGSLLRALTGPAGSAFGRALAPAGDLDGDGAGDVLVGAPFDDAAGTDAGAALTFSGATGSLLGVVHGSAPGDWFGISVNGPGVGTQVSDFEPTDTIGATQGGNGGPGYVDIFSAHDFAPLGSLAGAAPGDGFGSALSQAGDLDADGTGDLLIGAEGAGRVTAVSGATFSKLLELQSPQAGLAYGRRVAGLGDVNGDGVPDLGVGSPLADGAAGRLWIHSGSDGAVLLALVGDHAGNQLGDGLAAIGDLDLDGKWDVAVAESRAQGEAGRMTVLSLSVWNSVENGLPGLDGVPRLSGEGGLTSNQTAHLVLESARPIASATLLVGLSMQFDPPAGVYVPTPDIVIPGLQTTAVGTIAYDFELPSALPSGAVVYQQFLLADAAAPGGIARSNTVAATVP